MARKPKPVITTDPDVQQRIELLRWDDFGPEDCTCSDIANGTGCPNGVAACLLATPIMIFSTEVEDGDVDGPSLIFLHHIAGQGYMNLICADCSEQDDHPNVLKVARKFAIGLFTTNLPPADYYKTI